jgi:hypothetical protein
MFRIRRNEFISGLRRAPDVDVDDPAARAVPSRRRTV